MYLNLSVEFLSGWNPHHGACGSLRIKGSTSAHRKPRDPGYRWGGQGHHRRRGKGESLMVPNLAKNSAPGGLESRMNVTWADGG